jgi:DNA-binding MarR family transcriptional regulator
MSTAMNLDLSNDEALILRTMWELKALGTRTVTIRSLSSRLSNAKEKETVETIKRLEARGLVTIRKGTGGDLLALSPLGAALVRQLQDRQLGDLGHAS